MLENRQTLGENLKINIKLSIDISIKLFWKYTKIKCNFNEIEETIRNL
jgi:hypothetical protein